MLSRETLRRMLTVLDAPTHGFVELVRRAELDRARDFRGAILHGVDFGTDDLSGFDFSGADLSGAELSRATGLDCMIIDAATRLPAHARRPPPGFDLARATRMIRAGLPPPAAWRPFITQMSLGGGWTIDLSLLAGLTALKYLNLRRTPVSDVSPLAGLTALESLDLTGTQVSDVSAVAHVRGLLSPVPHSPIVDSLKERVAGALRRPASHRAAKREDGRAERHRLRLGTARRTELLDASHRMHELHWRRYSDILI